MYDVEYPSVENEKGVRIFALPAVPNPDTRALKIKLWRCLIPNPIDVARVNLVGICAGYC